MLAPSLQQFSLRTEMLPSYIPIRVAEKILFVGESVQMFENHNHSPSRAGQGALEEHTQPKLSQTVKSMSTKWGCVETILFLLLIQ